MKIAKFLMMAILCGKAFASFAATINWTGPVYWTSGTIELPDGSIAGAGDVTMYALVVANLSHWESIMKSNIYNEIKDGMNESNIQSYHPNMGGWMLTALSDKNGQAAVTTGSLSSGSYINEWAVALFVCEYDGHEYYKQVAGNHYSTATWPEYTNTNMAERGEWVRGVELAAVPEPSSSILTLLGVAILTLRRRLATRP